MKVLVTGGAGYLGSNLVYELSKLGFNCLIYDNFFSGHKHIIEKFNYVEADIRNKKSLSECFSNFKPDVVIHLASLATVGECENNPDYCYDVNVNGTEQILQAMVESNVSKIIFASSAAVYESSKLALNELSSINPVGTYAKSQLEGENLINHYFDLGINSIIFRIFNIAGAQKDCKFGELHEPETHLIPLAIEAAFAGKEIKIFGNDYKTRDGSAMRDYVHVTDVTQAFAKACNLINEIDKTEVFNLGSGTGVTVLELIDAVFKASGKTTKTKFEKRRLGDEAMLMADNSKAKKLLEWNPKFSDINNIIKTANKWYLANAK